MFKRLDWLMIAIVLALCGMGVLVIANAKTTPYQGVETGIYAMLESINFHYPRLHMIWVGVGLLAAAFVVIIDYRFFGEMWLYIYIANIALLLMVLLIGATVSGNTGWFRFATGADQFRSFQPAELCKVALIVTMAKLFARTGPIKHVKELLPVLLYFAIPVVLVLLQGERGSVVIYFAIFLGMLLVSGTSFKIIVGLITSGALAAIPAWFVLGHYAPFVQARIRNFINPSADLSGVGYQVDQSKLAIGSGQLTGRGLFSEGSRNQLNFIPVSHSDFVFASLGEAVGFVGCLVVLLLYLALLLRFLWMAGKTADRYGSLIIVGVASMFLVQTIWNVGMTIGVTPVMGVPLPFMSYGGSAMLTNMIAIGLVLNVWIRPQKQYM